MTYKSNWWICPKCKSYKVLHDGLLNCVRCSHCGRFFDLQGKEILCNTSSDSLQPECNCDLG